MSRINIIEIVFAGVALVTAISAAGIGSQASRGYSGHIDSGLDGGAVAFGLISASCMIVVGWIEITKFKKEK